jgi:hypothetical protein
VHSQVALHPLYSPSDNDIEAAQRALRAEDRAKAKHIADTLLAAREVWNKKLKYQHFSSSPAPRRSSVNSTNSIYNKKDCLASARCRPKAIVFSQHHNDLQVLQSIIHIIKMRTKTLLTFFRVLGTFSMSCWETAMSVNTLDDIVVVNFLVFDIPNVLFGCVQCVVMKMV